ncbi:hypothetical protein RIF29_33922 [Crotalaria pallida]|uniref:Uncharacterized protein n=1 Tax=Crotalaria pallida TaxID=3830 RepID=A0AAN9E8V0_CROPI
MGSTSMRSKEGMTTTTDLSGENKKLKKENERLSYELAMAKKQCNELVAFLRGPLSVGSDQINRIIKHGSYASGFNTVHFGNDENRVGEDESGSGASLKLFGVWLKEEGKEKMKIGIKNGNSCHKRGREDEMGFSGPNKELKTVV